MSDADIELEFYEQFFFSKDLEPYPVQEEAFSKIFAGDSVLITVPTGTGKTLMGKAALMRALKSGQKGVYTTPLRALTEEKYREFCDDFGEENVGFATGDYRVNPEAPIQVLVAEILWNQIYANQNKAPAQVVVMDEGHYFNDPERGYVWEQSIIGLHPDAQLVILSATIGHARQFCQWARITRKVPLELVSSTERKVPLEHQFREDYLVDTVKDLYAKKEYPAIIFSFGRKLCFERARLLKSCPRFVDKDEQKEIKARLDPILLPVGLGKELEKLLMHGIGVHHAGVLPAYRRLVEELTADRLLKFVVTTETIAAGINLPAKRVVFPSLKKVIRGKARILYPSEYHQMAGRAGRPQFDKEGIAITLGPEQVIQDYRKEVRDLKKRNALFDEAKIKKKYYTRAKSEAKAKKDVIWDEDSHRQLHEGEPEALKSRTRITAEQILAIGLPDLTEAILPGVKLIHEERRKNAEKEIARLKRIGESIEGGLNEEDAAHLEQLEKDAVEAQAAYEATPEYETMEAPATSRRLDIRAVIDHLLLPDAEKWEAHKRLAQITANLQALDVLDDRGRQIDGKLIGKIRGVDGTFVWYLLKHHEFDEELYLQTVEYLVDHDVIQKILEKKEWGKIKAWILEKLRQLRRENPTITFDDVEQMYWEEHPRELTRIELIHQTFASKVPHPELHGGKKAKSIWKEFLDDDLTFTDYVERHNLDYEEGSLFTYLARIMKVARMLHEVTNHEAFAEIEKGIRYKLAAIDERVMQGLW